MCLGWWGARRCSLAWLARRRSRRERSLRDLFAPAMKLLLARHGQTAWNASRRFQGSTDVGLSERGRAQAEALGERLRGRRLAAVYVSPLCRARETAAIVLGQRSEV